MGDKLAAAKAGIKIFTIQSYDGNSKTTGSIGLKYYTSLPYDNAAPVGLNTSQTGTMLATSDRPQPADIPIGFTSQVINDAIERSNIRFVDWDSLNENMR
jgi:hypothetical protein